MTMTRGLEETADFACSSERCEAMLKVKTMRQRNKILQVCQIIFKGALNFVSPHFLLVFSFSFSFTIHTQTMRWVQPNDLLRRVAHELNNVKLSKVVKIHQESLIRDMKNGIPYFFGFLLELSLVLFDVFQNVAKSSSQHKTDKNVRSFSREKKNVREFPLRVSSFNLLVSSQKLNSRELNI